ncbi:MAG: hypothetical protein AB7V08_00385 [Elusimicrobiales bacterium]
MMSPAFCVGGQDAVVLAPASAQHEAMGKLTSEVSVIAVIPAEEADVRQAGLLNSGGPVVVADPGGRGGYKVYDGTTGADINSKFKAGVSAKEEPRPVAAPIPEPAKPRKAQAPQPKPKAAFNRNHIGLSAGMTNLEKNEDSLDMLATNPNAEASYTKTTGRFRIFFEHYFSEKYGLGLAVGAQKGAQSQLDLTNRTLEIEGDPKSATVYVIRRFGRHFGVYLGGGVDITATTLDDPSNLAGVPSGAGAFEGQITAPHAEAGLIFSAGNFSLRFSLKEIMGEGTDELARGANGPKYLLITRNNNSVSYKYSGQSLGPNEEYFKVDMGGFASAVTLNYAFGNW